MKAKLAEVERAARALAGAAGQDPRTQVRAGLGLARSALGLASGAVGGALHVHVHAGNIVGSESDLIATIERGLREAQRRNGRSTIAVR
ncbi:MAG: hypothetical protein ABR592_01950 [Nitriliruptorales bacterium]